MNVQTNCLVSINVRLFDAQGELLEATDEPLVYLHGAGDILPKIEEALAGHSAGAKVSLHLEPHDAFGDYDEELLHIVARDDLGDGVMVGMRFDRLPGTEPDGTIYTVTDLADDRAVLDGNHALAGLALRFDLTIEAVEPAGDEELREAADAALLPDFLRVGAGADDDEKALRRLLQLRGMLADDDGDDDDDDDHLAPPRSRLH